MRFLGDSEYYYGEPKDYQLTYSESEFPVKIINFKQTKAECDTEEINGHSYYFKYECVVTVELNATERVEDWGYYLREREGKLSKISLQTFDSPYQESQYIYYTDYLNTKVQLYGYVKYEGADIMVNWDNPNEYQLSYQNYFCPDGNHPHAIDLGLPSGTKWACCDLGAANPESEGEVYSWGLTEFYSSLETYPYAHYETEHGEGYWFTYPVYDNFGIDIAGTQYDTAKNLWGGDWRMPTKAQTEELISYTSQRLFYDKESNYRGYLYIGPIGEMMIAHPKTWGGAYYYTSTLVTEPGYYVTDLDVETRSKVYIFSVPSYYISVGDRLGGFRIRPVKK